MNRKEIILVICLILVFFSALSFASASDDLLNATSAGADVQNTLEINNENVLDVEAPGTFSDLNDKIQKSASGATITLDRNYVHSHGEKNGITIDKDITINGNGVTLDGAGQSSIFTIVNNAHVVLNNIHFLNARGVNGSAVISSSGSFNIVNSMFINNVANDYGGAVYVADSNSASAGSTLTNNTFISNNANFGGACYIGGDKVTSIQSKFINNAAYSDGGALYVAGINDTSISCSFINNTATLGNGGAMYFHRDSVDFYECIPYVNSSTFNNNKANFNGGSIYGKGLFLIVRDSHFSYDTARNGAGIYLNDGATIRDCSFYKETAHDNGGAIYFSASIDDSMIDLLANPFIADGGLKDSKIINCTAGIDGGAGYVAGNFAIVSNVTYINNSAGHDGGAGYVTGHYAYLINSTFINNRAARDGGALTWTGSHGTIALVNCIANRADGGSGSICMQGSDMSISYSMFMLSNSTLSGGAIYVYGDDVRITNSLFDKCAAVAQHGGAIYVSGTNALISECQFSMTKLNIGVGRGGAIYVEGNNAKIINTNFDKANAFEGGFVYVEGNDIKIENMSAQHSYAVHGGALYIKGNNASVINANLSMTNATELGGAVYVAGDFANIDKLFSEKCISYLGDGGSIYISGLNTTLSRSSFIQNMAPGPEAHGGSIAIYGDNAKILNSTFEMCTSYDGGVIYIKGTNTLIDGYTCTKSLAYNDGGAIYIAGNNATVADFDISLTNATNFGGAIYILGDFAKINNSNFTKCIAHNHNGGALYILGLNATVTKSSFIMNRVNTDNGCGGSVAIHGNYTKILNCTFDRCTAYDGGVLYINGSYALVDGYSCTKSFAANNGGAVYVEGDHATIADFDMSLTNATNYGGALYIAGEFTRINNSTFTKCIADNCNGGALYILGKSTTLSNSSFSQNRVNTVDGRGGSIAIHGDNTNMLNCSFMMCTAYEGGLVYINGSNTNIDGFKSKMTSAVKDGGSVYIEGHDATINNFDMSLSNATHNGGAIFVAGDNVNILNGNITATTADEGHGGAIYVGGYNTTVDGSNFSLTQASNGCGGAMYLEGDLVSVENSNFMYSFAYDGGIIYIGGHDAYIYNDNFTFSWAADAGGSIHIVGHDVDIVSSNFRFTNASKANDEYPGWGGAIYIEGDNVNITSSTFFKTIAESGGSGGAIFLMGENVNIEKSNFTYCAAPDYFDNGGGASAAGAIAIGGNDATVGECNFMFCNSRNGGVMFIEGSNTKIFDCNISNSFADYDGGALYIFGENTNISRTSFDYVKSERHGGAVYIRFGEYTNIEDSNFTFAHSNYGGAIDVDGSDVKISNSSMIDCYAVEHGGAIYISGNNVSMIDSNFTHCFVNEGNGGAIYWIGSIGLVEGSNFVNNTAPRLGGAIFMKENSKITFDNSNFINNSAGINGGAIDFNRGAHDEVILNSNFVNNYANRSAGAVFWFGTNGTIKNSNFTNNRALGIVNYTDSYGNVTYGGYGGAVMWTGAQGIVDNCRFEDNYAQYNEATKSGGRGGAVYLQGSDVGNGHDTAFYNSVFINNTAGFNGGAVDWYRGAANGRVENSTFINNTAGRSGGGIYWSGVNGTIKGSKFENNSAIANVTDVNGGGDGGAVLWIGHDGTILNSTFKNNNASYRGGAVFLKGSDDGISGHCNNVSIRKGVFENNFAGSNGGAVDFQEGATNGAIIDSVFNNNTAMRSAGAVYWYGTNGTIKNSNFTNNLALGKYSFQKDPRGDDIAHYSTLGGNGGAIVWTGTGALIDNSSFVNNSALRLGGSIYIQKNSNTTVQSSKFINNTAGINGGAIDFNRGAKNGAIINSTFENNVANRSAGAVFWFGTNGAIKNSNFTNNKALGIVNYTDSYGNVTYGGYGGAVMWTGEQGIVDNCRFEDNYAQYNEATKSGGRGGAVYLQGSDEGNCTNTKFINSVFINNTAGFNGGAVDWYHGAENGLVENSTFENNSAARSGGAIYWSGINGTIKGSNFINNSALGNITDTNGGGDGGAVLWVGYDGDVENSNFTDNHAAFRGGAIFLKGSDDGTSGNCDNVTIVKGVFENNFAGSNGGAVDFQEGATNGAIIDSVFNNNTALRSAGAVYWYGTNGTIKNSNFTNNRATGNYSFQKDPRGDDIAHYSTSGGNGGAIVWTGTGALIDNSSFVNNSALRLGGSIYIQKNSNTTVQSSKFINNTAGINGGAIDFNRGAKNGAIINSTFENNVANRSAGAVFWFGTNGAIRNSNFTNNRALGLIDYMNAHGEITSGGSGGAVLWTGEQGIAENCIFKDNEAAKHGGAVFLQGSDEGNSTNTTFDKCTFVNNTAGDNGGAIDWNEGAHEGNILNSHFESNIAKANGGAVFWNGHNGEIIGSTFINNTAKGLLADAHGNAGDGGAVIWFGINGTVDECKFIDNVAAKRGGAVYLENCSHGNCENTTFVNSYFANNVAGTNGGAIDWHVGAHDGLVDNVTFVNNTAKRSGGAIFWSGVNGTIKGSEFINNSALGNVTDSYGGGDGGAVIWIGQDGKIENTKFNNNKAAYSGGAVFLKGSDDGVSGHCENVVISSAVFENNFAGLNGGAVDFQEGATDGKLSNSVFNNNSAARNGGAVFWFGTDGVVDGCNFTNNKALGDVDEDARGIHSYIGNDGNKVLGGSGGAIAWTGNIGKVNNCDFINNSAKSNGGAVFLRDNSYTVFKGSIFANNSASQGGALYWKSDSNENLTGCEFIYNKAKQGSAIYLAQNNLDIIDSTFLDNKADAAELNINVTKSNNNHTLDIIAEFKGNDNLINAIWNNGDVIGFKNVTYLGLNGVANTGSGHRTPIKLKNGEKPADIHSLYQTQYEDYQNITLTVYDEQNNVVGSVSARTNISGIAKLTYTNNDINGKLYEFVAHPDDNYYAGIENSSSRNFADVNITTEDISFGENESIIVNVVPRNNASDIPTGNVSVWVDGNPIGNFTLNEGKTNPIVIYKLGIGKYDVTVKYNGDGLYFPIENSTSFEVNKADSFVILSVENYTHGQAGKLVIKAPQNEKTTVNVVLDGKTYGVDINESGCGVLDIPELDYGVYEVEVYYPQTQSYLSSSNSTVFEVYPRFHIDIVKSSNASDAYVGELVNFTITVSNKGHILASEVKAYDELESYFEYISSGNGGKYSNGVVRWNLGNLDVNENITLWIVVKVTANGTFTNIAHVSSTEGSNQSETVNVTVKPIVDVQINKTVNVDSAFVGDEIKYVIAVKNNGPSTATDVNVTEHLSEYISLIQKDATHGSYDENTGIWSVGTLNNGETATLTLNVKIISEGVIENIITVKSAEKDLDDSNNEFACENVTAVKKDSQMKVTVDEVKYGEDAEITINLPEGSSGTINISVDGKKYIDLPVENGKVTFPVSDLSGGSHEVDIDYSGDDTHKSNSTSINFNVAPIKPEIKIEVVDIFEGDIEVLNVSVNAPGTVNVTVDGITVEIPLDNGVETTDVLAADNVNYNGKATWKLINLEIGEYSVLAVYNGNENYTSVNATNSFVVKGQAEITVSADDVTVGETVKIKVKASDDATGNVTVTIDGKKYTKSLKDGVAEFKVKNLKAGNYVMDISYSGDEKYLQFKTSSSFKVSEIKRSSNVRPVIKYPSVMKEGDDRIVIGFPSDAKGSVFVFIGDKLYSAPVKNGKAIFNIAKLKFGTYNIDVMYSGDDKYSSRVVHGEINVDFNDDHYGKNKSEDGGYQSDEFESGSMLLKYSTGNPVWVLLLMILGVFVLRPMRYKK